MARLCAHSATYGTGELGVRRNAHHIQHPAPVRRSCGVGAYSHASFAIEPIQLPIVPVNVFALHPLHTTAARERGADRSRRWLRGGGAEPRTESRGP